MFTNDFYKTLALAQKIHNIKYLMEEVRVTFKNDFTISIDDFTVDAKIGEISSLPRWIAKLLAVKNYLEIQDTDTSIYISRAINRERISKPHDLSSIDTDFYVRVNDYICSLENTREFERERENTIIALNSFVASRLEKIVKIAVASPLSGELEKKLSTEEKELYHLIHDSSSEFKSRVIMKK